MGDRNSKVIIIGRGPGGASAAIYLARFCFDVTLVYAPEIKGRTEMATGLENYLSHTERISGTDFMAKIMKQLKRDKVQIVSKKVTKVSKSLGGIFVIRTADDDRFESNFLISAPGIGDVMPQISGLDPYYDHSIFHCTTCDWYRNRDKKITIITDTDQGLNTALSLNFMHTPPLLTVVPVSPNFSYSEDLEIKLQKNKIKLFKSPLVRIKGRAGYVKSIELADGTTIESEVLFTKLGHTIYDHYLENGGINAERDEFGFLKVNFRTFETSIENLFAVGPCNEGPDQAIIAAGQGAMAALEIRDRILEINDIS